MSELSAGTVFISTVFRLDEDQLRAVAEQGRAALQQQMAGVQISAAAEAQATAAARQAAPSASLLNNLPPVATGAGGGATSSAMAQATTQARLDAARARATGGVHAQIDSLVRSAQAIGGQAGAWLETAATMMFARTREAFTRSAEQTARQAQRLTIDQFTADIADRTPARQRRDIAQYLQENPELEPRDRIRLERQRNQLYRQTVRGQFFGPPNTMGLMLNAMFGGIEIGHAALAFGRGSYAIGHDAEYEAYTKAADGISGGFLGAFANLAVDPFGERRAGSAAIAGASALAAGRTALRLSGVREMRDARAAAAQSGAMGFDEQFLSAKAAAIGMRDRAEDIKRSLDEHTDKEVLNLQATQQDSFSRRSDRRYLDLLAKAPAVDGETGAERQNRLSDLATTQISNEDASERMQFRNQRGGERDKVTAALRESADAIEKNAATKIAFQIKRSTEKNLSDGGLLDLAAAGNPFAAAIKAMNDAQTFENEDLYQLFGVNAHLSNPEFSDAFHALRRRHEGERRGLLLQQEGFKEATALGTLSMTETMAGRTIEGRYAAIDSEMGVQMRGGEMYINGFAPGADGYAEQAARRNASRRQAGIEYRREAIRDSSFESSAALQLNNQPLQAQLNAIIGDAEAETEGMSGRGSKARGIWRRAGLQIELAKQQFNNQTLDIETDQLFETKSLTQQMLRNPIGAQAFSIAGASLNRARQLFRSGRPEDAENERKLGNARLDVLGGKYDDSFEMVAFDPRTSGFDARNSQDPAEIFGSIESARDDLNKGDLAGKEDTGVVLGEIRDAMVELKNAWNQIKPR